MAVTRFYSEDARRILRPLMGGRFLRLETEPVFASKRLKSMNKITPFPVRRLQITPLAAMEKRVWQVFLAGTSNDIPTRSASEGSRAGPRLRFGLVCGCQENLPDPEKTGA